MHVRAAVLALATARTEFALQAVAGGSLRAGGDPAAGCASLRVLVAIKTPEAKPCSACKARFVGTRRSRRRRRVLLGGNPRDLIIRVAVPARGTQRGIWRVSMASTAGAQRKREQANGEGGGVEQTHEGRA